MILEVISYTYVCTGKYMSCIEFAPKKQVAQQNWLQSSTLRLYIFPKLLIDNS